MASVDRKWLPPVFILCAAAASIIVYDRVPPMWGLELNGLFPWPTPATRPAPRWLGLWVFPTLALIVWIGFRSAPTAAGQGLARRLFRDAPDDISAPAQFQRFENTYETIVLSVVLLILGFHAGLLAAALHANAVAARIIPAMLGGSLVLLGNVMPRLRPNWVAGLRSQRLLNDPLAWRQANRTFGTAIVASGVVTMMAAIGAPRYGLLIGIAGLLVSCFVGLVAGREQGRSAPRTDAA